MRRERSLHGAMSSTIAIITSKKISSASSCTSRYTLHSHAFFLEASFYWG